MRVKGLSHGLSTEEGFTITVDLDPDDIQEYNSLVRLFKEAFFKSISLTEDTTSGMKTLIPEQIIVNGVTTVFIYEDGEKITSRPSEDDTFDPETGIMACLMKRIFSTRAEFKRRLVERIHHQD